MVRNIYFDDDWNFVDRVGLCGDLSEIKLLRTFPLPQSHFRSQWQQGNLWSLRASSLPHHHRHTICERCCQLVALQRLRDGRHYLRHRHCLVLCCVSSLPCSLTAPRCLSRPFTSVLRDLCRLDVHNPIQKINRFLGQRPQMEPPRG